MAEDADFRDFGEQARAGVSDFYRENHRHQTLAFARDKRAAYASLDRLQMGVWDALERLDALVDDSDPDTELSQLAHALQTAEAIKRDGHPDWFVVTGLIHDLGKVLCLFGEEQWCVVGDTFPLGCAFRPSIVHPEFFEANPDRQIEAHQSALGIYREGCGLDQVTMSWGHDEYLYLVMRDYLPSEALYMIRYHSFYACHRERDYEELMNADDRAGFEWVRRFNPYDLYSKADEAPDLDALRPEYEALLARFFPATLRW